MYFLITEDIDVPEERSSTAVKHPSGNISEDTPPKYEDVVSSNPDKNTPSSKVSGTRLSKPLKSIMKKSSFAGDKPEKSSKIHKKDFDSRSDKKIQANILNDADSHSPKNPKHSISVSTGLGSSQNGVTGEFVDPGMVGVQVIRSSSSVTGRTFQLVDYVDVRQKSSTSMINRTSVGKVEDNRTSAKYDHLQGVTNSNKRDNNDDITDDDDDDDDLADHTVDTAL